MGAALLVIWILGQNSIATEGESITVVPMATMEMCETAKKEFFRKEGWSRTTHEDIEVQLRDIAVKCINLS